MAPSMRLLCALSLLASSVSAQVDINAKLDLVYPTLWNHEGVSVSEKPLRLTYTMTPLLPSPSFAIYVNSRYTHTFQGYESEVGLAARESYTVETFLLDGEGDVSDVNHTIAFMVDAHGNVAQAYDTPRSIEETEFNVVPLVCAAFISCRRLPLLAKVFSALQTYASTREPYLSMETAVVDNGSGPDAASVLLGLGATAVTMFSTNHGIAQAFNTAVLALCRAPYVLTLEDDWLARAVNFPDLPVLAMAITVLEHDPTVLEVWLHDIRWHPEYSACNRSAWLDIPRPVGGPVRYRRQCQGFDKFGEPSFWGSYTNRASLKRRSTLEEVGPQRFFDGEVDYATRVNARGLCSAHLCYKPEGLNGCHGANEATYVGLFQHGDGIKYESSSGHGDKPRDTRVKGEL